MANNKMATFWCFTDNCPKHWLRLPKGVTYMIWQLEEVSHLHHQGYVELVRNQRLSWLRKHVSDTAHWEIRQGSGEEARHYCMKPVEGCECKHCKKARAGNEKRDKPYELGTMRQDREGYRAGNGLRNDIIEFRDAILGGKRKRDLVMEMPFMMAKYPRFYDTVNDLFKPKERKDVKVTVALGAAGTGKTLYGLKEFDIVYTVPLARTGMWFTGFDHHKHVLIDDFDGRMSKLGLKELLRLLHNHTERVETKGGHSWWHPETIFVSTNIRLEKWYEWGDRTTAVLQRRVHRILDFGDIPFIICKQPKDVTKEYDWSEKEIVGNWNGPLGKGPIYGYPNLRARMNDCN